jgi:hypothetical protein
MYIYHNTCIESLVDILYDGYLRAGKYTKQSNYNIHDTLQKYIYFNIIKKRGFRYILLLYFHLMFYMIINFISILNHNLDG